MFASSMARARFHHQPRRNRRTRHRWWWSAGFSPRHARSLGPAEEEQSWAIAAFAGSVLARETMILFVGGLFLWQWLYRRSLRLPSLAVPVVGAIVWRVYAGIRLRGGIKSTGSMSQGLSRGFDLPLRGLIEASSVWALDSAKLIWMLSLISLLLLFLRRAWADRSPLAACALPFLVLYCFCPPLSGLSPTTSPALSLPSSWPIHSCSLRRGPQKYAHEPAGQGTSRVVGEGYGNLGMRISDSHGPCSTRYRGSASNPCVCWMSTATCARSAWLICWRARTAGSTHGSTAPTRHSDMRSIGPVQSMQFWLS